MFLLMPLLNFRRWVERGKEVTTEALERDQGPAEQGGGG